jgi:hypothetical protein
MKKALILSGLALFTILTIWVLGQVVPGVPINGPLVPFDAKDTYSTLNAWYAQGVFKDATNLAGLNGIPNSRRVPGMLAYTSSDGHFWTLDAAGMIWIDRGTTLGPPDTSIYINNGTIPVNRTVTLAPNIKLWFDSPGTGINGAVVELGRQTELYGLYGYTTDSIEWLSGGSSTNAGNGLMRIKGKNTYIDATTNLWISTPSVLAGGAGAPVPGAVLTLIAANGKAEWMPAPSGGTGGTALNSGTATLAGGIYTVASPTPAFTNVTYADFMAVEMRHGAGVNAGGESLKWGSGPAKAIFMSDGAPLPVGELTSDVNYFLTFDSTKDGWILKNAAGSFRPDPAQTILTMTTPAASTVSLLKLNDASIGGTQLATNSVDSGKIVDGSVSLADMATNSVDASKIVDASVSLADLAADSVNSSKIVDGTIVLADLAGNSVNSSKIVDGSVSLADMGNDSVDSSKIVNNSVSWFDLANDSVDSNKIINGSITAIDMFAGAVNSTTIEDGSITGVDIAGSTIVQTNLANNSVGNAQIIDGTITGADIGAAQIGVAKLNMTGPGFVAKTTAGAGAPSEVLFDPRWALINGRWRKNYANIMFDIEDFGMQSSTTPFPPLISAVGGSPAGTFSGISTPDTTAVGIVAFTASTGASYAATVTRSDGIVFQSGNYMYYETRVRFPTLSTATEQLVASLGFDDTQAITTNHTDCIVALYTKDGSAGPNGAQGKWVLHCQQASSGSYVDSTVTVAANTWYTIQIYAQTTQIDWKIDGVDQPAYTGAGIPTGLANKFAVTSKMVAPVGVSTSRVMQQDYVIAYGLYTTPTTPF